MSSKLPDAEVLRQTESIWKFLEHLSLTNPSEYQTFINKVLKDGEEMNFGPPVEEFAIETVKLPKVIPIHKYYLNFAKWKQLPKPENETSPVPIATSEMRKEVYEKEWSHIIDVTLHPDLFQTGDNSTEKCVLIELAMRHIEFKFHIKLSRRHRILEETKYIGNKDNLLNFICPSALKSTLHNAVNGVNKNLTLEELRKLTNESSCNDYLQTVKSDNSKEIVKEVVKSVPKEGNLELNDTSEILKERNTKFYNTRTKTQSKRPKVEMTVDKHSRSVQVTVYLPDVQSVQECDLDIAESSLTLHVPDKYELDLQFPLSINIDQSTAKFIIDQKILLVNATFLS